MDRPICCEGDMTTHGGKVIKASGSFTIDGRRVARIGDLVSCPLHGHKSACTSMVICTINATVDA